jgi:low affinity Fe/Cu permease
MVAGIKCDLKSFLPHGPIGLLYCCLLLLALLCPTASAHDAFYPHHRQDFQEIQQNRGKIAVITAAFLTLLTVGIVFGLKKGDLDVNEDTKMVQERLRRYALEAAKAAMVLLKDDPSGALKASIRTYAQTAGAKDGKQETRDREAEKDQKGQSTGYVSSISCKIGEDFLKAKIFRKGEIVNLELSATCNEAEAKVVVSENGEIHSSVFIN